MITLHVHIRVLACICVCVLFCVFVYDCVRVRSLFLCRCPSPCPWPCHLCVKEKNMANWQMSWPTAIPPKYSSSFSLTYVSFCFDKISPKHLSETGNETRFQWICILFHERIARGFPLLFSICVSCKELWFTPLFFVGIPFKITEIFECQDYSLPPSLPLSLPLHFPSIPSCLTPSTPPSLYPYLFLSLYPLSITSYIFYIEG
jgi:hypothetical protein